ncbi:MAG: OmpH family outer membrane protein [Gammaproteobacteria bacterium]|nr:OmpH family outer membrane protein [Gammaproteobacteria bacterium]MCZ0944764.1 OmpH family outer membrane protein [Gammaproteobacteria bacterium]MDE0270902.1 OmpH family outer membrane protein [Gammaproteobacteria bacterium]
MINPAVINRFRMKRLAQLSLLALSLGAAAMAAAELKIAVLDTQRALVSSEEAKALLEQAQSELKKEEEEVNALGAEIQALQEKLQTDGEVMSPTEQRKAQKDIEDKRIDYEFLVNKLQKALQDRRQDLLQVMVPKVDAVLKDLIELEGYDLIMERANLRYVNPKHDITRRVTEKLNQKRDAPSS